MKVRFTEVLYVYNVNRLTRIDRIEVVSFFVADQRQHVGELRSAKMPRRVPRKVDDRRAVYVAGQQHDH